MVPVKNLPLLLNLSYVGFNRAIDGDFIPTKNADGTWITHCNQFIQYVCNGFGYDAFRGMTANEIIKFVADFKNGWIAPQGDDVAQTHANSGVIVIAGFFNPSGHGHVCLVLPGILEMSGTYKRRVPKVANVGVDVFYGRRLSYAFRETEMPTYYSLAGMI